jgi:hypothetical protein
MSHWSSHRSIVADPSDPCRANDPTPHRARGWCGSEHAWMRDRGRSGSAAPTDVGTRSPCHAPDYLLSFAATSTPGSCASQFDFPYRGLLGQSASLCPVAQPLPRIKRPAHRSHPSPPGGRRRAGWRRWALRDCPQVESSSPSARPARRLFFCYERFRLDPHNITDRANVIDKRFYLVNVMILLEIVILNYDYNDCGIQSAPLRLSMRAVEHLKIVCVAHRRRRDHRQRWERDSEKNGGSGAAVSVCGGRAPPGGGKHYEV